MAGSRVAGNTALNEYDGVCLERESYGSIQPSDLMDDWQILP